MKTPEPFHPHILLAFPRPEPQWPRAAPGRQNAGFARIQQYSTANPMIDRHSRAFMCKSGVEPRKNPFHPLISLKICEIRLSRCAMAAAGWADRQVPQHPTAISSQTTNAEMPIEYGGGSDLSPRCHSVPPFHPHRHALLDRRPDLRVMTGAGERFVHGEQTETD